MPLAQLLAVIKAAEKAYQVGDEIMSDLVYDYLKEQADKRQPKRMVLKRPKSGPAAPKPKPKAVARVTKPKATTKATTTARVVLKRPTLKAPSPAVHATSEPVLEHVPAPVPGSRLVRSPYWLGSMDKMKLGDGQVAKWSAKYTGPYLITAKMDGMSVLLYHQAGSWRLITRGQSLITAQDVSTMLPLLTLPDLDTLDKSLVVRAELLYKTSVFQKKAHGKKNPRGVVAGVNNHVATHDTIGLKYYDKIRDLTFVAYELIQPTKTQLAPSQQLEILSEAGFEVVKNTSVDHVTDASLSKFLDEYMSSLDYAIDGLVVYKDQPYQRVTSGNPKYARAFKKALDSQIATTTVLNVFWNISRYGYLNPVVEFEPMVIEGNTIKQASAHNAKMVRDKMIGPGARIKVILSGSIIPKVEEVLEPATQEAVDSIMPKMKYIWNETGVDLIVVQDEETGISRDRLIEQLYFFLVTIGAKGVGKKTVESLYDVGYERVDDFIQMSEHPTKAISRLAELEMFGPKQREKIVNAITKALNEVSLSKLMIASGKFGRGIGHRKLEAVFDAHPDLTDAIFDNEPLEKWRGIIMGVEGFSTKSTDAFMTGLLKFSKMLTSLPDDFVERLVENSLSQLDQREAMVTAAATSVSASPVAGQKVVFTGFRDDSLKRQVQLAGGQIQSTMSASTTMLVIKNSSYSNKKTQKAEASGVQVLTRDDLAALLSS